MFAIRCIREPLLKDLLELSIFSLVPNTQKIPIAVHDVRFGFLDFLAIIVYVCTRLVPK